MGVNSTLKKSMRFHRKTAKSGGAKTKPKLRATAEEWVPSAKPKAPNAVNNLAERMVATSIVSKNEPDYMSLFAEQWRAFKAKIENAVAIDCEMVGVGYESALAHVAIVDFNGKRIYDKYVIPRDGLESITNYRTEFSGITPAKLQFLDKRKHSFETVKREVHKILEGKTIVGHGLINDFKVLDFTPSSDMVWDTTIIDTYLQSHRTIPGLRQARKLKAISKEFANNNIQREDREGHSPLEDARASMNLYRLAFSYPKITYTNMSK